MQNPLLRGVWTQPPYNNKNPPTSHFFIPFKPSQSHQACRFDSHNNVTSHFGERVHGVWLTACVAIVSALSGCMLSFMFAALEQL